MKDAIEAAAVSKKTATRAHQFLDRVIDFVTRWGRMLRVLVVVLLFMLIVVVIMAFIPFVQRRAFEVAELWAARGDALSYKRHFLLQNDGELIECHASVGSWSRLIHDLADCAGHSGAHSVKELRKIRARHAKSGEVNCPWGRHGRTSIREKSFYPLSKAFPPEPGRDRQAWCCELVYFAD